MDENGYFKDASRRIVELLKATFGNEFKAYFVGSPNILIPEVVMPCVVVQKIEANVRLGATGTDNLAEKIVISIISNSKDGLNDDFDTDSSIRALELLAEGRVAVANTPYSDYHPKSIVGLLRRNIDLGSSTIDNDIDTNYSITPRVDQPAITEATITVVVRSHLLVQNRT